jgi:hypothetical protein
MGFDPSKHAVAQTCVVCRRTPPINKAHVIPQSIGGRLWGVLECAGCNHSTGSRLEKDAAGALEIAQAVLALEEAHADVPAVRDVLSGLTYATPRDNGPQMHGRVKAGEFHGRERKLDDGSTLHERSVARKRVAQILRDRPREAIEAALARFDAGDEIIAPSLRVVHRTTEQVEIEWVNLPLLDRRVPLHTAYLFLAFLLVLAEHEALLDLDILSTTRAHLLDAGAGEPSYDEVTPFGRYTPSAVNLITLRPQPDRTSIFVQYFKSAAWEVCLPALELPADLGELRYVHDLATQEQQLEWRGHDRVLVLAPGVEG